MSGLLALVPARGGSKRLPRKNIRELCGLPLLAYTVRCARQAQCFDRIVVSTDDPEIAELARTYGADVPWLRSVENSTDGSTSIDAILEVLERIENDGAPLPCAVMLLQPTSPFRSIDSIRRALALFDSAEGESVVSVSPADNHPWWCKSVTPQGELLPFLDAVDGGLQSQLLPPVYVPNGVVYLSSVSNLRSNHSLYSEHTRALIIESREESLDIDTEFDWLIAEAICKASLRG